MPSRSRSRSPKRKVRGKCKYSLQDKKCDEKEAVYGCWFCNKHLNMIFNLKIQPSAIKGAGNGLFAGSYGFKSGDIIGEYSRYDILHDCDDFDKKIKKKDKDNHQTYEYLYGGVRNRCWDARYQLSVITRYANDSRKKTKNNAYFDDIRGRSFMIAGKGIKPGEEIFCNYGKDYDWSFLEN